MKRFLSQALLFLFPLTMPGQADPLYERAIEKADSSYEFKWLEGHDDHDLKNKSKFEKSRALYSLSTANKPKESYPFNRIKEIDHVLNYFKSPRVLASADSVLRLGHYSLARKLYIQADSLYPSTSTKEKIVLCTQWIGKTDGRSLRDIIAKVLVTDSICHSIDNNKNLKEFMSEGEFVNKRGGFETQELRDQLNLYRIKSNRSEETLYTQTTFYYDKEKVIKAVRSIQDSYHVKPGIPAYSVIYYFLDGKLIQEAGEDTQYSNAPDILKEAETYLRDKYAQAPLLESAIFGVYCGECSGHCATMLQFHAKDSTVSVDSTDSYFKQTRIVCSTPILNPKVVSYSKNLLKHIPPPLLSYSQPSARYGCPDCSDGCGIYLELRDNLGYIRKFHIDTDTSQLDKDIKAFALYFREQWRMISKAQ